MCMKYASHDILVNMDDDDFYMPHSIKARVKLLLTYPKINMVGSGIICCYDTMIKRFYLAGSKKTLSEATMCFTRDFWKRNPGHRSLEADAEDDLRDWSSVDHLQGSVQRAQSAGPCRRHPQFQPVHRDHAQHQRDRNRRVQPRLGQPRQPPETRC